MNKWILGLALALAFSVCSLAQTSSSSSTGQSKDESMGQSTGQSAETTTHKHHKNAAGESEIKGCLNSSGGTATLTTAHGKTINVTPASGVDLAPHNGHEVKLTGTWAKSEAASAGGKAERAFDATKVDHIADTCTAGAGGMKHKKGGSSGTSGGETPKS